MFASTELGVTPWLLMASVIVLCIVSVLAMLTNKRLKSRIAVLERNDHYLKQSVLHGGDELWDWHIDKG